uniref:Uncharacterized protein n=1 Tax=Avena sativa TaxID=4498 RepID=A0ACD5TSN8_AVESA
MAPRRSPRLPPQIQASEDGTGATHRRRRRRRSPRLHHQTHASEDLAGVTCQRPRRSRPTSLPDNDDMMREILLRLPPLPSSLTRASAVCRRWRRLVTDPKFLCSFRAHHRKPPLLGVFQESRQGVVFIPVLDPPDRIPPACFDLGRCSRSYGYDVLGCRHGRVLLKDRKRNEAVVCDPITGEQHWLDFPPDFKRVDANGAVLCAALDHGHVNHSCHGSPFKVVLVSMYTNDKQILACVYSSETGLWGNLIATGVPCEISNSKPAVLIGNCLYWLSFEDTILKFDLDENSLIVMRGPPVTSSISYENRQIVQTVDGDVGYAVSSYLCFQIWRRNVIGHGVVTWKPWKTIELQKIFRLSCRLVHEQLIGYCEDVDVVFFHVGFTVYMVQLKSMQSRELYEIKSDMRCHPFTSFYIPGEKAHLSPYIVLGVT